MEIMEFKTEVTELKMEIMDIVNDSVNRGTGTAGRRGQACSIGSL